MGKIWLQTSNGNLIHLPIVEPDVNTPDSPVKIPVSVISAADRCLSLNRTVNLSSYGLGTVTLNFTPQGRTGSCNQCGQCCVHCKYLTVKTKVGKVNGTECSVRANIFNISKGCLLSPQTASEITNWPACGFTFTGGA